MTLRQFLLALRARYHVVLLLLVGTVGIALAVSMHAPVQYTATASVLVDVRANDPLSAIILPGTLATQVDILTSDRVAKKVVMQLKLDEDAAAKQRWMLETGGRGHFDDWIAGGLLRNLKVTPFPDKNVITIAYRGSDSRRVAEVANAFAQGFIDTVIEMKVEPAKQYALWFGDQAKLLREKVESAQARLSRYQQSKGIVDREEKLDVETTKLRELSAQLTVLQEQTTDSRTKQKSGADTLPEIMGSAVITGLKTEIAHKEATLQETAINLGSNHPQYQRLESEIESLRQKLAAETQQITRGYSTASAVGQSKEAELRAAIEAQKRKLLALRNQRDELDVLQRDVDAAVKDYDAVANRLNQTSLESQVNRTNVSLLTPAVEPLEPSFPKPLNQTLLISIAIGILLGAGSAYALEMYDRRIRSAEDLAEMLPLPVLGVIERTKSRQKLSVSVPARPQLR